MYIIKISLIMVYNKNQFNFVYNKNHFNYVYN